MAFVNENVSGSSFVSGLAVTRSNGQAGSAAEQGRDRADITEQYIEDRAIRDATAVECYGDAEEGDGVLEGRGCKGEEGG